MVFSNLIFIYVFLPLCLVFYYAVRSAKLRNLVLAVFSLAFYAWGEPIWVLLLIFSAFVDFFNGLFIEKCRIRKKGNPILGVICSLVVNLGILFVFKYSAFFVHQINLLTGLSLHEPTFSLPIGISFYTFQTISYTVDVYRGKVKVQHSFLSFLLYVSMFFQLVAGPIVRYESVASEIDERRTTAEDFNSGLVRFVCGLAKKVIIANTVGQLAANSLAFEEAPASVAAAWFGVAMFTLQIYFDFSGYSDMAIGLGRMFGFHFPENFNYPYVSCSATEFWRRWHISLGSFFRDYVYIPLGGNRKHQMLNLAVVWFLTGLWHGASWNFIIWGMGFGVLIILEKLFMLKALEKLPKFFSHIYALFFILIGWAVFWFTDLGQLGACLGAMFGAGGIPLYDEVTKSAFLSNLYLIIAAIVLSMPVSRLLNEEVQHFERKSRGVFAVAGVIRTVLCIALLAVSSVMLVGQTYNPFLYFRF
ncbi:MAG: MBOAT family O-acyltransferase [Oscillospiraceae bacterium]